MNGLVELGALRHHPDGLDLGPSWVRRITDETAWNDLASRPLGIGALLLHTATVERDVETLFTEVTNREVDPERDLPDQLTEPDHCALADGLIRVIEIATLACPDVPVDHVEVAHTLAEQISVTRWPDRHPHPVFGLPDGEAGTWSAPATWTLASVGLATRAGQTCRYITRSSDIWKWLPYGVWEAWVDCWRDKAERVVLDHQSRCHSTRCVRDRRATARWNSASEASIAKQQDAFTPS